MHANDLLHFTSFNLQVNLNLFFLTLHSWSSIPYWMAWGDGPHAGHHPYRNDDLEHPAQLLHGVAPDGMANAYVSLDCERCDRQHRRVG